MKALHLSAFRAESPATTTEFKTLILAGSSYPTEENAYVLTVPEDSMCIIREFAVERGSSNARMSFIKDGLRIRLEPTYVTDTIPVATSNADRIFSGPCELRFWVLPFSDPKALLTYRVSPKSLHD